MTRKSVVIIGGGYAGVELAKAIEAHLDVQLVEPREAFVHAPAMIRSLLDPKLLETALIPYDRLLTQGRFVADRARSVDATGAKLASGECLKADYVVVATGSSNGGAFKPEGDDIASFRAAQEALHTKILAANRIVVVGAGPVGTELAGEIAHALPKEAVTLVAADEKLFPYLPHRVGASLLKKLEHMGVEVILGTRADLLSTIEPSAGTLQLSNGRTLHADLIIPAIGAKPQVRLLEELPGATFGKGGRIAVDPYLRPSTIPNLFALGDAVDAGDAATIVAISRQQPWLAKTLKALAAGKTLESIEKYASWKSAPMLVPLGPRRGSSFLVVGTFGDWVTRTMKGSDLFVPKYRKLFNQP
ncbi:MAG: FAD-dependent oxidoreductase [Pseudomonadota bacterium]